MLIDWLSSKTEILLNPRLGHDVIAKVNACLPQTHQLASHLWFATSGSTGGMKFVALSKQAFLASAKAVNQHLQITGNDIWLNPLPLFHVGGLSIYARAYLNGAKVIPFEEKWDCQLFKEAIEKNHASLTSLVPTQVYDLVMAGLHAPSSLRFVIVGGGQLSHELYAKSKLLGWQLLPTYGMTEASSQIATAKASSKKYPEMETLSHLELKINTEGFICVRGSSLLTCYGHLNDHGFLMIDPKVDGWFATQDKGGLANHILTIYGRGEDFFKIMGENVALTKLEALLEELKLRLDFKQDAALVALEDERNGHSLHLATDAIAHDAVQKLYEEFNRSVMPYERILRIHRLRELPRSPLNKLLRSQLRAMLGS